VEKKYLVILGAAFASILFISFIYLEKDADQEVRTPLVMTQIPLWCFEKNTDYLWESTVTIGCINEAQSLGATRIPIPTGEVFELNPLVKTRFLAAEAQAKLEGFKIEITSGFRSEARQLFLFNQAIKKYKTTEEASKWVLPPSISHHPKGIALDVNYPTGPTGAKWLEINGYKFGLCRVYENEWWHFEPLVAPGELCPELIINALAAIN
jgi:D-alanyl-D-alanine carboxypeptidase